MFNQKYWVLFLLGFSLVAVFTSQTAVDLSDLMVTVSALTLAIKSKDLKTLLTGFQPAWIWPLWLAVIFIGMVVNVGFHDIKAWGDFFEFRWILTFLATIYLGSFLTQDSRDKFMLTWTWILLALNATALILFLLNPHWRAQGILKATMAFSHNIAPLFCFFSVYTFINWKNLNSKNRTIKIAIVISSALLTVLTYTRGVWIGSIVGLLAAIFLWNRKKSFILLGLGILSAAVLLVTNQRIYDRTFGKTVNETQSNDERLALWRGNWAMIQDHPVLGVGIGQNKKHLRKYYDEMGYPAGQRESHAHNQYLQMWAGTGTLGIILFLYFYGTILNKVRKSVIDMTEHAKSIQLGLLAALLCFMVGGLTESNFNIAKNRFLFLILAGIAVSQTIKHKNKI